VSLRCFTTIVCFSCLLAQTALLWGQEVITKVKTSGPKSGGPGTSYSEWYLLKSDPAPAGYVLSDAQFKLQGGSSCSLDAQCLEGERSQTQSVWLFRIQGHNDPRMSEAVLTTKYTPAGVETTYSATVRTPERFSSRGEFFGCYEATDPNLVPEGDGPWCTLSAAPPKSGYQIKSASFSLEGDRDCVGNDFDREVRDEAAQCRLTSRTASQVSWQFRMLGRSDANGPVPRKSFGRLKIIYEKLP
jgi:hypothetical protein